MESMPLGRKTTSTERMRLKRLRELGRAEPLKKCTVCGKTLKKGAGSNKAYDLDLCWVHWTKSEAGRIERRRQNLKTDLSVGDVWGVAYFGDDPPQYFTNLRKALSASARGGRGNNVSIFICWSDGRVTMHDGLTARSAVGLTPEDGDELMAGADWFRAFVPKASQAWFGYESE